MDWLINYAYTTIVIPVCQLKINIKNIKKSIDRCNRRDYDTSIESKEGSEMLGDEFIEGDDVDWLDDDEDQEPKPVDYREEYADDNHDHLFL